MAIIHAYHTINLGLHVLILFIFLTVFFFTFISQTEESAVSGAVGPVVDDNVNSLLNELQAMEKSHPGVKVNWEAIDQKAKDMQAQSQGSMKSITENNKRLKIISFSVIGVLVLFLVLAFLYFRFFRDFSINYIEIIITNLIAFAFVGLVEYLFFVNIASKYSVVTPSLMNDAVMDKVQTKIYNYIQDGNV
jgi:hypothetical protein